jgi:hypothetical protein
MPKKKRADFARRLRTERVRCRKPGKPGGVDTYQEKLSLGQQMLVQEQPGALPDVIII